MMLTMVEISQAGKVIWQQFGECISTDKLIYNKTINALKAIETFILIKMIPELGKMSKYMNDMFDVKNHLFKIL